MKNNLFIKIILIFIVATVISVIAIKNLINVKYRELGRVLKPKISNIFND